MRVAFTSTDGKTINQGFGKTSIFQIWEIGPEQAVPCAFSGAVTTIRSKEESCNARVNAVAGCDMVCTLDAGDGSMAKLVSRGIYPLRTREEVPITEMIGKLQCVLRNNPPPWMKRTIGAFPGEDGFFRE
jgi:nitrogen fixation protein NifX